MLRLKTLTARGCRGIVDGPPLHFGTGGLLLCGDNGVGKSSFIDALEKVLTGRCSSLDTGDQGISWSKHGAHIEAGKQLNIELVLTDGNKDVTVSAGEDPSCLPRQVQSLLEAATKRSFILRRRRVLEFIDSPPRDRYQAIQGFLNLTRFQALEEGLSQLANATDARVRKAVETRRQHREALMVALGMPSASDPANENFIASVNASLVQAQIPPVASLTDVSERLPNVETGLAQYTDVDAVQKIAALEQRLSAVPSVSALAHAATSYLADRRRCVDEEQKLKGHFYSEILENGLRWIQEDGLDRCPLCDSLIDAAAVAEYVSRKLAESERLRALRERQAQSHEDFLRAIVDHRRALASVAALWSDALGAAFPKQATDLLAQLAVLEVAHSRIATVDAIKLVAPTILAQQVDELPRELLAEIEEKKAILPDVKRYTDLFAAKACLLAYAVHWPQLSAAQTEIARLTTSLEQIRHICELAEQGRKKAVQKLMDKTADLANEYFMKIHPDEGIGKPSLTVTERGKASLALTGRFYSKETDPRGHYSEGHLDSLGLCMFLAIRRLHHRQFSDLSILILDDVLHSVDGRHRRATADLIFDEFKDHQIVVTTHDPLWFENLKAAARRYFPGRAFTQHRIADWSIKVGPVWGDHLSDYEWLCSPVGVAARPADRVSKAGRLLEEMLHNLCDGLQAPVPFKLRGDYTLDPLWTSFVKAANKYRGFSPGGHTAIDEIDQLRILRNLVGAHWNEWAAHLTDSESRDLCSAVVALRAAVYCPTCERFVARVPRPADLCTCECGAIQYKK